MTQLKIASVAFLFLTVSIFGHAQNAPSIGANVNMVSGITLATGDPFLTKQNESTIAVSSVNPLNMMGGSNDYRLIPLSLTGVPGDASGTDSSDAWVSRYWSTDGGRTWRSKVIPGCPVAINACSGNTALQGLSFASDPTIRSGPNGTFFYSFIAGNRGTGAGGVIAVQRWFDMNNTVTYSADPFLQDKLNVLDNGTVGQLLDKTWNAADVSRPWNAGTFCTLPTSQVPVPAFNVYVSYSNFVGQAASNPHPQAFVATSTDCGNTFGKPKKVSQSVATNQGTVLAIDPQNGTVYLFWRQIATTVNNTPDAIYFVKSTDGGSTWSSPSVVANNVSFFEQDTAAGTFRAEAFATVAISVAGGVSRVHVAWAQRGVGPNGDGRIVMTTSSNGGGTWTTPSPVDNSFQNQTAVPYAGGPAAVPWATFNPFNAAGYGHQYQPALVAVGPKLTLIWQDQRLDHTTGVLQCPSTPGHSIRDCTEIRTPKLSSQGMQDAQASVFTADITDATPGLKVRHTVDAFGGQAIVSNNNPVFTTTRVSQYPFGSMVVDYSGTRPTGPIQQLRFNVPNLPIFSNFTLPFDGDYNDVAAQTIKATGNPASPYAWNMDGNTVVHGTWTTNQDVVAPKDGNWAHATPLQIISGTTAISNPSCLPGQEGVQNQNIYTATLFNGIDAYAAANSKYLSPTVARQFNITVQNGTSQAIAVSLAILTPTSGTVASFKPTVVLSSLGVAPSTGLNILPFSSLTRTVWITSSNPGATVTVNVVSGATSIPVLLNPDPAATILTANQAADVVNNNQADVTVVNTRLANANLTDVGVTDNTLSDNTLSDNTLSDNTLSDNTLSDNTLSDNTLSDNTLSDNTLSDNTLSDNTLSDNTLSDNTLSDNTLSDAGLADSTVTLFNNGTSDVAFNVKTLMRGQAIPTGYDVQLIIHKTYDTQFPDLTKRFTSGATCGYSKTPQSIPVLNAKTPTITSPTDPTLTQTNDTDPNAYTLSLLPQEVGRIVVRLVKNGQAINQNQSVADEFGNNGVKIVTVNASSTLVPIPVVIETLALPDGTTGSSYSPDQLQSTGGFGTLSWSLPGQSSTDCSFYSVGVIDNVPPGLTFNSTGVLSGTPTAPGQYCFRVEVSDSSSPKIQTDAQLLTMFVHGTQTVTFPAGALVYGSSLLLNANSSAGLPMSYSTSGACTVSGDTLTATAGSGSCTVNATQAGDQIYQPLSASNIYKLSPAPLTVTANPQTKVYGTTDPTLTYSVTSGSLVGTDMFSGELVRASGENVGSYAILQGTLTAGRNYTLSYLGANLTITAATLTVTADNKARVYGDPNPLFTANIAGFKNGQTLANSGVTGGPSLSTAAASTSAPGFYAIAVGLGTLSSGNGDYTFSFVGGVLTVTKATPVFSNLTSLSIAVGATPTALGGTISYASVFPTGSVSITLSSVMQTAVISSSGTFSSSFATGSLAIGTYTVTYNYAGDTNFNPASAATGTLKVSGFQATGLMSTARAFHTATLLNSGKVLVAGGVASSGQSLANAEVYDPATGTFTLTTNSMPNKAAGHTATLMGNGKVLIVGGGNSSAQVYDPSTNSFSGTGGSGQRSHHIAVLLPTGKVLVAGGSNNAGTTLNSAQLYDPSTGTFTPTGNMIVSRDFHTATLLPDGKVLITGGRTSSGNGYVFASSAEIYDPVRGIFTSTLGPMTKARYGHTAAFLNGKVLVSGGDPSTFATAELYDPGTQTFTATGSLTTGRQYFTSTAVGSSILVAGGQNGSGQLQSSELYHGQGGVFSAGAVMTAPRAEHTATLLNNGNVLIVGGIGNSGTPLNTAELYVSQ